MSAIFSITVNATHFYLLECTGGKLLFDAGWEWGAFQAQLNRNHIALREIRWVMFSHHHPDHAGLVQEVCSRAGARLIIQSCQIPHLAELAAYLARKGGGQAVRPGKDALISPDRAALLALGVRGQIVETPGHSPDSISLLLDSGAVFSGDLALPGYVSAEQAEATCASWGRLLSLGAREIYPAHGGVITAEQVRQALAEYGGEEGGLA